MKPSQKHSDAIFYQIAADEVGKGTVDEGLLAKAAVKAEGDKKKAEALYIEWRVELLIEQAAKEVKAAKEQANAEAKAKKQNESNLRIRQIHNLIVLILFFLMFAMLAYIVFGPFN